jgi:hypothetical protein
MAEMSAATLHSAPPASKGAVLLEAGRVLVESAVSPHVLGRVAARFVLCPSGKRSGICDGGRHVRLRRDGSVLTLCFFLMFKSPAYACMCCLVVVVCSTRA